MSEAKEIINLGVRVIIIQNNKILVIRQTKPNGRDVYILPGGGIEKGEDIFTAAEREVKEEGRLKIKAQKLLYVKELFGPNLHSFEFYVLGKTLGGRLKLGYDPEKGNAQVLKNILFMPLNKLKNLSFHPKELKTKLEKDNRQSFKGTSIYLGAQRFSPKQFKRLFGTK